MRIYVRRKVFIGISVFKFRMFEETSKQGVQGVQDECLLAPKSEELWSNMGVYSIVLNSLNSLNSLSPKSKRSLRKLNKVLEKLENTR